MKNTDHNSTVKAIERLRLIKNTKKEWYTYLNQSGFKTNYRGFDPRDAAAIFNMIDEWVYSHFDIYLSDILDRYERFSSANYTKGTKRRSTININSVKEAYKEIVIEGYQSSHKGTSQVISEMEKYEYDPDLLFLITIGAIPAYDNNPQDVLFDKGIKSMYAYIKNFIAELYPQFAQNQESYSNVVFNVEMEKHPFIKEELYKIEKRIESQEATRIDLIAFFVKVTNNLYINYHKDALYESNMAIDKIELPEIDHDCIWIEADKKIEDSNFYWIFSQIGMDYFLRKYDRKDNTYTEYTIIFFRNKEETLFYATHPEAIRNICQREPIENQLFAYGNIEITDQDNIPQEITFHSYADKKKKEKKYIKGGFPPKSLKRIRKTYNKWFDTWEKLKKGFINAFPQYDYDKSYKERLIGSEYIFVEKERMPIDKDKKTYRITSWYQVPRFHSELPLEEINIDSLILVFSFLERNYISFVEYNICIDVTDEKSCNQYGISITSDLTIQSSLDFSL